MKKKLASTMVAFAVATVAFAVPAAAQGSRTDPDSPTVGDHTLTLTDGEQRELNVLDPVNLTEPFELAQPDGRIKKVSATSVDGVQIESGGNASKFAAGGAAPLASTWHTWAAPGDGNWHTSVNGKAIGGSSSAYQAGYKVTIDTNALSGACVKVKGFKQLTTPAGKKYYDSFWKSIGCAGPGGEVTGTVQWGSVLAYEQIQVKSESYLIGSAGMFQ
ncbi:hypothetical protein LK09_02925 [Microbacterium mangrovi]|uniref:Lipoprotein n=1 Tax=Microbacterium mangrovi TaxID=1348253 RepID=A0A0B2A7T5_9MICO|nr:hypothetical protein [Microbacterium mangrovi]KHK99579.1 hypothetical protein LK09_02925 [Microbacterium mangrovi]